MNRFLPDTAYIMPRYPIQAFRNIHSHQFINSVKDISESMVNYTLRVYYMLPFSYICLCRFIGI